jgi:hypothetical protein
MQHALATFRSSWARHPQTDRVLRSWSQAYSPGLTYRGRTMTRLLRGSVLAVAVLLAFNAAMMAIWFAVGASRDALVVAGWIAGDAMLCLIALWATDR